MLHEVLKPLIRLDEEAQDEYERAFEEHQLNVAVLETERRRVLTQATHKRLPREQIVEGLRQLQLAAPSRRRYVVNDPTIEKLGVILNENPAGVLLCRDEISGFLATMERAGHENDRAFYLECWNGYSGYTWDRIGRGTINVRAACVSILGAITPGPLGAYLREAFSGEQDDGLVQRFQLSIYPDPLGRWHNIDRPPDTDAANRASRIFERLGRSPAPETADAIPFVRFEDAAQGFFDDWRKDLEGRIRGDDEHPVMVAHLAKFRSLMPSLAVLFHLCDFPGADGRLPPVALAAAARAVAWCRYLEPHARRIYHLVTSRVDMAARLLGEKIKASKLQDPFTARDVYRPQWTGLADPNDVTSALQVLEDLNWVQGRMASLQAVGGRPTMRYNINPRIWEARPSN
jgi:putative DNA primase/helicase